MLENSLLLSTHQSYTGLRRYMSADDAVGEYLRAMSAIDGCAAIDYAKPLVQTAPSPENPNLNAIDDIIELRRVFVLTAARVQRDHWIVWCERRINLTPFNAMPGVHSRTARRWVEFVDAKIEGELAERGLMIAEVKNEYKN